MAPAQARPGRSTVALLGVRGPGGRRIEAGLGRALRARYRLVSRRALSRAAAAHGASLSTAAGRSTAARALGVTALVSGAVARVGQRWALDLLVFSGDNGQLVGRRTLALRGRHLDRSSAQLAVSRVALMVARCRPPPSARGLARVPSRDRRPRAVARRKAHRPAPRVEAPRPVPTPPPAPAPALPAPATYVASGAADEVDLFEADLFEDEDEDPPPTQPSRADDLGFRVADAEAVPAYRPRRASRSASAMFRLRREAPARQPWDTWVEASAGVAVMRRKMSLDYPQGVQGLKPIPNFNSGIVPALRLDAALFPLVHLRGPLRQLGVVGRYHRTVSLGYHLPGVEPLRSTLHMFEVGLRYRWRLGDKPGSPTLNLGAEFGRQAFVVWNDGQVDPSTYLPNLAYLYLKLAAGRFELPVYARNRAVFGFSAEVDYLQIFTAGAISRNEGVGEGPRSKSGVEVGGGAYGSYRGFFARVSGFYRHIFYSFDPACPHGCDGSARDVYSGVALDAGYAY